MTYIIMRIAYGIWILGAFSFSINALSVAIFSKKSLTNKAKYAVKAVFLSLVWPVALMSPSGRSILTQKLNQL